MRETRTSGSVGVLGEQSPISTRREYVKVRWYSIDEGEWQSEAAAEGKKISLEAPDEGQWTAVIRKA